MGLAAACVSDDQIPAMLCLLRATADALLVTGPSSGSDKLRLPYRVVSEQYTTDASHLECGAIFQYAADRPDVVGHARLRVTALAQLLCNGQSPPSSNWKSCNSPYPGIQ
jgi:hypothetical protein